QASSRESGRVPVERVDVVRARVDEDHRGPLGGEPDPGAKAARREGQRGEVREDLLPTVGDRHAIYHAGANLTEDRPAVSGPTFPSEKRRAVRDDVLPRTGRR